jgi:hypothetical protein
VSPYIRAWQLVEDKMIGIVKMQPKVTNHLGIDLIQHEMRQLPGAVQDKPAETPSEPQQ